MSQCVLEQGEVVVLSCGVCLDSFAAPAYFLAPPKWFLSHLLGNRTDDSHCSDRGQKIKAMKSSLLVGLFCGSEFWGFSLLKIGWVFLCIKLKTIVSSALIHSTLLSS
jgi:hypothetical protein